MQPHLRKPLEAHARVHVPNDRLEYTVDRTMACRETKWHEKLKYSQIGQKVHNKDADADTTRSISRQAKPKMF